MRQDHVLRFQHVQDPHRGGRRGQRDHAEAAERSGRDGNSRGRSSSGYGHIMDFEFYATDGRRV